MRQTFDKLNHGVPKEKSLDREDIESLGFEYKYGIKEGYLHNTYLNVVKNQIMAEYPNFLGKNITQIEVYYIGERHGLEDDEMPHCEIDEVVFNGKIKNKSALKTLLKQVEV